MALTVRDVLQLDAFAGARLLAGERGLDRCVEYVDILEVPDARNWLRGGELLVTSGYAMRHDVAMQSRLIEAMIEHGSAGLVIKVRRFLGEIAADALALADRHHLPLIDLPSDVRYVDVTTPILANLLTEQTVLLQRSADIHRKLTEVVIEGGGMPMIAQNLANAIGRGVIIEDKSLRVLAAALPEPPIRSSLDEGQLRDLRSAGLLHHEVFVDALAEVERTRRPIQLAGFPTDSCWRLLAAIMVDDDLAGYLTLVGAEDEAGGLDVLAAEQASTVAALEVAKRRAVDEARNRLQADTLNDIISHSFDSANLMVRRARALNWDISGLNTVIIADIDDFERLYLAAEDPPAESEIQELKDELLRVVRGALEEWSPRAVAVGQSDSIIMLVRPPSEPLGTGKRSTRAFAEQLSGEIARRIPPLTVSIGVGGSHEPVTGLAISHGQAREALRIGRSVFGDEGVFLYDELGLYRLLFDADRTEQLATYYRETLAPLDDYDEERGTNFNETVRLYVENGGNAVRTAEALFIHRNTLNYRLRRAAKVLGEDLSDPQTQLRLLLAYKVKRILEGRRQLQGG